MRTPQESQGLTRAIQRAHEITDKDINSYIDQLEKEIASLKELIEQAYQYVEYAVTYSTPLSQKLSERWISEVETRRKK